ncbi:ABC-F family ATP-binding cassette domain-containing protein [Staphylococcus pseudintermedius]|uniref:ABC-F family ATP-binding cassette domain-containing protein n=1 Tax=Staphylococcus pseudintermedius TaxID=283734 RepID=UPI000D72CBF5|nr:ABC-F family ATP-binding cassette domain-containing protein [Staphylococcus pseudintermedius]EGQ1604443.1 ABC-F family ATP-binding cassette domain-containing protein [Staphylococcus pseudintermedius]EGQ2776077.1 ABC-F family ATP-binding cassette domain-containing protein [Staphylococcus pseudintermedius]EGQ2782624.1 ABC-F family ATP-binding cassette domain-containing protein [Staphylococcus pseudintermedius]EGQ2799326.1 ABC-F family ATP-binding cassette domain-containing protein [Staphylococ
MILMQLSQITKSFDGEEIFEGVNFEVKTGERIGIVGRNGAGKSTLMKIIAGVESYDSGHISKIKGLKLGYLTQQMTLNTENTVFEEMAKPFEQVKAIGKRMQEETDWLAAHAEAYETTEYQTHIAKYEQLSNEFEQLGGYHYDSKIKTVLNGLDFSEADYDRPINDFSGGQKTRLSLAQMLLSEPDLLLLDEPTNHLDMATTEWLEDYLKYFKGAIVIISHDRFFLDKIVTQIYDVSLGEVKHYVGNYAKFIQLRDQYFQKRLAEYERQQSEIKRLETFVKKNITRASTSGMAKSRRKMLEKMTRVEKPMLDARSANIQFDFDRNTGNDVMHIQDLEIGYRTSITAPIRFEINKGDHIGIIGPNGIGKSTLIKTLAKRLPPLSGQIIEGANLKIGYYDQKQAEFRSNKTILDFVWDQYPHMPEKDVRAVLGRFLFTQDEVLKVINDLSGGEKARLQLALLMLERNNVLILDEPTNHLDIDSKEMLEQALKNFEGTLIFVSHDRYFINELANRIFDLNKTGGHLYLGDYQYYLEKLEQQNALAAYDEQREDNNTSDDSARSQNTYQDQKALRREKRKIERQIEADEQKITELEARIAAIDVAMTDDTTMNDYEKTQALANERTSIEQSLEQVMTNWEELQLTLSQFEDEMD